jgi:hypothetical protein
MLLIFSTSEHLLEDVTVSFRPGLIIGDDGNWCLYAIFDLIVNPTNIEKPFVFLEFRFA